MSGNGHVFPVDDITHDDEQIKRKAQQVCECDVSLEAWKQGSDFETLNESICAVLVDKGASGGAVRIYSNPVRNIVTGQEKGVIMAIIEPGVVCRIFGGPLVRYIRRQPS